VSLIFSVGRWGGVYVHRGFGVRICVGFFAITLLPCDIDDILSGSADEERV